MYLRKIMYNIFDCFKHLKCIIRLPTILFVWSHFIIYRNIRNTVCIFNDILKYNISIY